MRTQAQIEASRNNGSKSRGPASEQGRTRSSQNAQKHGLSATKSILIDGESEEEWQLFHDAFLDKFQPRDFVEERLVVEMAVNQWRLERVWAMQAATINQELPVQLRKAEERYKKFDAVLVQACAHNSRQDDLQILAQHETRLSRNFDRALRKFNDIRAKYPPPSNLQNEPELAQEATASEKVVPISSAPKTEKLQNEPKTATTPVFSSNPGNHEPNLEIRPSPEGKDT